MKKIFCYAASLLVAAGAMIGCTEDITTDTILPNEDSNNVEFIEVTADLEIEESRTTLTDGGNGGKVVWSEGDTIGAIAADGTVTECAATSINGSSAKFEVPSTTKYAVYPYASDDTFNTSTKKLSRSLVSNITLDGSNKVFGDNENVMCAHLVNKNLSFKHLCGYIEVKLKGTGTVKHIALRDNLRTWDAMSGIGTIDFSDANEPKFISSSKDYRKSHNWVYATCSNVELSKSEAKSFYFVVPPRTYENLAICVQTDKGSYAITSKNAIEVNRAKIRPISAIDIDALKPATTTDLSVNGVANCYIVPQGSEAKYYSFPAQKINTTEKLSNAVYAHLLWSDREQLITNVNYDAATGTVSFKYAGGNKEGNAMISLLNGAHNTVWSWHIWCTDQPGVVKIKNACNTLDKYHGIMDRNLGATYAPKTVDDATKISAENATASMGLYYQYGRSYPFPKATSITNTTAESTSARFGSNSDFEVMYGFKEIGQTFEYTNVSNSFVSMLTSPTLFGVVYFTNSSGTNISSTKTNYHSFCKDLPKPCIESISTWHSENLDIVGTKGDTDPCPPGYCIEEWDTFKSALYDVYPNRVSQGASNKTYGYYYQCPTTKNVAWFPATGLRNEDGVYSSVGDVVKMWSMRNCSYTTLYGTVWYMESTTGATQRMNTTGANTLGHGYNVRCRLQDRSSLQTKTEEPESKNTLNILFVGNSLTQDGIAYLPYMLKNYYSDINFNIYMWYIGGKTMGNHYSTFTSSGVADIFSVAENSESWTNYKNSKTMADVLSTYTFDIVCLQEYFNYKTSYTDCRDWNYCRNYILKNYKGGNELKFISLFHAPLRSNLEEVYSRTKAGNALIYKSTVSQDMIPFGIAVYNALKTDLKNLGDKGELTPDGTHTQEGLPCLLQTYVALEWIFDKFNINKTVKGNTFRMTNTIYNKINVPGANLGNGVVTGTDAQYSLAQDIAIEAYKEGKQFLQENLQ
ncbi:MAG: hypothetical protein J6Q20_00585 [Alistipes sp.]|nr:hypothetical protein [Alistipes sp.]